MRNKLFQFLDNLNLTPQQIDDLNFILNKISDFESQNGIELEEEQAIDWSINYRIHYKKTKSK